MTSVNLPVPFEAYKGTEPYIFVSYAHKDGAVVYPQLKALHEEGYRLWYDEGIDPGNEWLKEIAQALKKAAWVLVFLTGNAANSRNVRNEINFALNKSRPLLAIYLEDMELPDDLELQMGSIQAVKKWRLTDEHYRRKLQKTLPENLRDASQARKVAEEVQPREKAAAVELACQQAAQRGQEVQPSIKFVALLDGQEVSGAKVNNGANTWETPVVLNLSKGSQYTFRFSHTDSAGHEYAGESQFTADWRSEQTRRINLATIERATGAPPQSNSLTLDLGGGVALDCILIQPGVFSMGADKSPYDDEKPAHKVRLTKPFYLGKFAVTQAQWERVMGANPSRFKSAKNPVELVSWDDCQDFIRVLNLKLETRNLKTRLPTEAEWEYACRAGTTTEYSFGDSEAALGDYAWFKENSGSKIHEVGGKKPNPWGLFDMHGNVWEWCSDRHGNYSADEAVDPAGPSSGVSHVLRGGSWYYIATYCRSACRYYYLPTYGLNNIGFRLVVVPR